MLDVTKSLPEDPAELRAFTTLLLAEVTSQAVLIAKLRHQLAGQHAHRFGASSQTSEPLQLALEMSEIAIAALTAKLRLPDDAPANKPKRKPIPDHIPRVEVELTPANTACAHCGGYDRLIRAGKVRSIGASNFSVAQMKAALATADREGLPRYSSIQPEYNLYDRAALEGPMLDLCRAEGLGVIPYYGLASGFLSGLYRSAAATAGKTRKGRLDSYMTPRGFRILEALDAVAGRHSANPAQVALAWVAAQTGLTVPIASATTAAQVVDLAAAARLDLTRQDLTDLNTASA